MGMAFPFSTETIVRRNAVFIILGIKLQNSSPSIMQLSKMQIENKISFYKSFVKKIIS